MSTPLVAATPQAWAPAALADFPALLADHAHCEKKAAAHALSLVANYPDRDFIIEPLIALAQEELRHFKQVYRLLRAQGHALPADRGDPYVQGLQKLCRHGAEPRLVDRLLVSALIEARSAERLALISEHLPAGDVQVFYHKLALCEAGHYRLFIRLCGKVIGKPQTEERLQTLAAAESEIMLAQPLQPRIH